MLDPDARMNQRLREDVVVSLCLSDLGADPAAFAAVRDLAARLDEVYRFREIIVVAPDTEREAFCELVEQVSDVRLFLVDPATDYYERRVIAAEEAIGDLVILVSAPEIAHLDALAFLDKAENEGMITLATRARHSALVTAITAPIIATGRMAGFKVNLNDLQTVAFPRTLLNTVLAHEEPRLALRFPPRDPRTPFMCLRVDGGRISRRRVSGLPRRLQMLQTLLVYLAPTILSIVALSSTLLTVLGMAYAVYVLGAWLLIDNLAPGWLTTSMMLTMSAVFMGVSTLGLSLGLQHALRQLGRGAGRRPSEEVNRIDLFGKVAADLNVELASEGQAAAEGSG